MGFLSLRDLLEGTGFDSPNKFLLGYSNSQQRRSSFSWVTTIEIVQMETWPGLIVGGAESQPSLTDDSQMQNKFFKANRMQLAFWDQDVSSSNTVLSAASLQSRKIIPQGAEAHKTLKLKPKLNLNPTWKIGHILPIENRIYSGPMLGYNPEKSSLREAFSLYCSLCCEAFFPGSCSAQSSKSAFDLKGLPVTVQAELSVCVQTALAG